jgi:twitching motility protein PilT
MLNTVLKYAQENECSDIHLVANMPPMVRHVGELVRLNLPILTNDDVYAIIKNFLNETQKEFYDKGNDVDTSFTDDVGQRYRLNIFRQRDSYALVMRLLKNRIPTIDELNLPPILKSLALEPRGLVLVTGPTGSGKSTTLAAMIDYINTNKAKHILTLEDPIEYIHTSKKSLVNQREIHRDALDFHTSLRSALREDPDVILVGEMRDHETISLAVTAAETGHLVFSTLHTTGAANTVDRIIDAFPPHQQSQIRSQLSGVLKGVVSQALLPKTDKSGRIAVHEIMLMTDAIGNLIRENKIVQINTAIQTGLRLGMQTFEGNLAKLVIDNEITYEAANEVTSNPELLKRFLGR